MNTDLFRVLLWAFLVPTIRQAADGELLQSTTPPVMRACRRTRSSRRGRCRPASADTDGRVATASCRHSAPCHPRAGHALRLRQVQPTFIDHPEGVTGKRRRPFLVIVISPPFDTEYARIRQAHNALGSDVDDGSASPRLHRPTASWRQIRARAGLPPSSCPRFHRRVLERSARGACALLTRTSRRPRRSTAERTTSRQASTPVRSPATASTSCPPREPVGRGVRATGIRAMNDDVAQGLRNAPQCRGLCRR